VLAEGAVDVHAPAGAPAGVVLLHPHPDMGGDRFNPVVDAVWRAAVDAGWAAVRFDFSSSDRVAAANEAAWALDLLPSTPVVGLVGYSFGAAIAAGLDDDRIDRWVLVAPPFGSHVPAADLPAGADERPKLVLVPAHDQFCPPAAASTQTAAWQATTIEPVPGVDHFLAGATRAVADRVLAWLAATGGR
jgi:alpha/beta superfamily hydrolase